MKKLICIFIVLFVRSGINAQVLNGDLKLQPDSLISSVYAGHLPTENPKWYVNIPDNWA